MAGIGNIFKMISDSVGDTIKTVADTAGETVKKLSNTTDVSSEAGSATDTPKDNSINSETTDFTGTTDDCVGENIYKSSVDKTTSEIDGDALHQEYEQNKESIYLSIRNAVCNEDLDKSLKFIDRYKSCAADDEMFAELVRLVEKNIRERNVKKYLHVLDALPENDYALRIHVLCRLVQLDYQNEVFLLELDKYKNADLSPDSKELPSGKENELVKSSISDLAKLQNNDYSKRLELYANLFKFESVARLDWIRCTQAAEELKELEESLKSASSIDYNKKIALYNRILELIHNETYEKELHDCEAALAKFKADKEIELKNDYANNKPVVLKNLNNCILQKQYRDAALIIEKYYTVACEDDRFNCVILDAIDAMNSLKAARLEEKLKSIAADDYQTKKDVYNNLLMLYPSNQQYLNGLYVCEEALGMHDNFPVLYDNKEVLMAIEDPDMYTDSENSELCELTPYPDSVNSLDSLAPVTDSSNISRVMDIIEAAAAVTEKAADGFDQAGAIVDKMIGLGIPKAIGSLPIIHAIGDVNEYCMVASKFCKTAQNCLADASAHLNEIADLRDDFNNALMTFQIVLRAGDQIIQASDQLIDDVVNSVAFQKFKSAVATVSSFVVSRYYMQQADDDLDKIQNALSKISDFLDSEFRSKIMALCAQVARISHFQIEIMEDDELRKKELMKLADHEHECIELIGQANISLEKIVKTAADDYEKYIVILNDMDKWYQYQSTLMCVLADISKLSFALNQGRISDEHCYTLYNMYEKKSSDVLSQIRRYHTDAICKFEIDIDSSRRKRSGIGGILAKSLSVFSDDVAFESISDDVISMIKRQTSSVVKLNNDDFSLFDKDVRLIIKNNHLYYYPELKNEVIDIDYQSVIKALKDESSE